MRMKMMLEKDEDNCNGGRNGIKEDDDDDELR